MDDDLKIMIEVARAIVEERWRSRLPDSVVMRALAHTVLLAHPSPKKELKLAPTEAERAKQRDSSPESMPE